MNDVKSKPEESRDAEQFIRCKSKNKRAFYIPVRKK